MIVLTPPARLLVWSLQVFPSLENWHPRLKAGGFFFFLPFYFFLNHKSMLVFGSLCLRRVRVEVSLCATWVAQMFFFLLKSWIDFFPPEIGKSCDNSARVPAVTSTFFGFLQRWYLPTTLCTGAPPQHQNAHTHRHTVAHTHTCPPSSRGWGGDKPKDRHRDPSFKFIH